MRRKNLATDRPYPKAKRSLGQNFRVDRNYVDRIVDALDPQPDDVVLEIGPGQGALTAELVDRAGKVFALEYDNHLAKILRESFSDRDNFVVIEDDALTVDFSQVVTAPARLRLIANLPYNVSTAILQRLFEHEASFVDCVLMFQREVVERITATPGTKDRGFLSVLTEAYFNVRRLFDVPPTAFRPVPNVWSSVVHLTPKREPIKDPAAFRDLVSSGFAQKRKTMLNNLKPKYGDDALRMLEASGIDPRRRAESLELAEWYRLTNFV